MQIKRDSSSLGISIAGIYLIHTIYHNLSDNKLNLNILKLLYEY